MTSAHPQTNLKFAAVCVAAIGVVYGDIGTSPLYAFRECFNPEHGVPPTADNVLGVLSLILWALTLTISVKYVAYVLSADNRGEGGVLALMALAKAKVGASPKKRAAVLFLGLLGAALLYGDGMITPAISVLSAVEGLGMVAPNLKPLVLPLTIAILVLLFSGQRFGTAKVASIFGPLALLWFSVLAGLGVYQMVKAPEVLGAFLPHHAFLFFVNNGAQGFLTVGAIFLVVTGAEALYADMGHFGVKPIRASWFYVVGPALLLNYLGQGALLLRHPELSEQPFFSMAPEEALLPLVVLSTLATIIASQALISGAFSLTNQAVMLGLLPRMKIRHTSAREMGQIYVPVVNWTLMVCAVLLVLSFGDSTALSAAYGVAVALTMMVTTGLAHLVAREHWGWSSRRAITVTVLLLLIDTAFLGANGPKVPHGGWVPLVLAVVLLTVMFIWHRGRELIRERFVRDMLPLEDFWEVMKIELPARVPGTAVFMTGTKTGTPPALLLNFSHNRVVHQKTILLTVETLEVPFVPAESRVTVEPLESGFVRVVASYGFMEDPDLRGLVNRETGPIASLELTSFFLGRESLSAKTSEGMPRWQKMFYGFLAKNSARATEFYRIPADRVVELGSRIEL